MFPSIGPFILKNRRIACAITDRNLRVVEICGAVELLFQDHPTWVDCLLPDMVPELIGSEEILADILNGDLPEFELSWINRHYAGNHVVYLTMVELPYRDQSGRITGLIHLIDDVSEIGELQQRLAQRRNELDLLRAQLSQKNMKLAAANAELQQVSDIKSKFVSIAAHELRSPLASITGFVELLLDEFPGKLAQSQRDYLEIVQNSAHRLLSITNNLLDVTRIEAGRVELVLQPHNLAALAKNVAAEFAPLLTAQNQTIKVSSARKLPLALLDETRAAQILGNLISNAHKYSPPGSHIAMSVSLAQDEGFLRVAVADNGAGIAPEDQPRLFNRFFRAKSANVTGASGAGLGLYIVRSFVELHGGKIWFTSQPGRGSTFFVTFPTVDHP